MITGQKTAVNKNYMSIAVSVLTRSCVARNLDNYRDGAARQGSNPQSPTVYSVPRSRTSANKVLHAVIKMEETVVS
jgi:hypothetical protein